MRLDYNIKFPSGMEDYLSVYGWHFSKKMAEWASSMMYRSVNGKEQKITPYDKEKVDNLLNNYGITLKNRNGYDCVYVANMCLADHYGGSVRDEQSVVKFVKEVIDDPDGYEGLPFTRFYADCIGSGKSIPWEDVL